MRFKFCGETDCPEWVLAEIAVLSKISSVRMKLLVKQVILRLLGNEIDFAKVQKLTTKDGAFDISDVKAVIAAIDFVLSNAAKFDVDPDTVSLELQQLGLPKENSDGLSRPYKASKEELQAHLQQQALKLPRLESVDWRVDAVLGSSDLTEVVTPVVQLRLNTSHSQGSRAPGSGAGAGSGPSHCVELPAEKFRLLYSELRAARSLMAPLEA